MLAVFSLSMKRCALGAAIGQNAHFPERGNVISTDAEGLQQGAETASEYRAGSSAAGASTTPFLPRLEK